MLETEKTSVFIQALNIKENEFIDTTRAREASLRE